MNNYKKWLTGASQYFHVPEEEILNSKKYRSLDVVRARKTFYYLCFRDGINLYRLSEALGKHRTSIISNCYITSNRDVEAEHMIRERLRPRTLDGMIEKWLGELDGVEKEMVLTGLILKKQQMYGEE